MLHSKLSLFANAIESVKSLSIFLGLAKTTDLIAVEFQLRWVANKNTSTLITNLLRCRVATVWHLLLNCSSNRALLTYSLCMVVILPSFPRVQRNLAGLDYLSTLRCVLSIAIVNDFIERLC